MTGYQTPTDLESVSDREIKRLRVELARVTAERDDAEARAEKWQDECEYAQGCADRAHAENIEQARLLGMSGEREARLLAELAEARKDAERYQTVRRMHVAAFAEAYKVNISTGKPFDEIIDDSRPFYFGPAKGDA